MKYRGLVLALFALAITATEAAAQRLPSDDRKPPLTRKENWGVHLGMDLIMPSFQPTRCGSRTTLPGGAVVFGPAGPCDGAPVAYKSRGVGVGLNVGVTFLRYILLGGEIWTVGFSGSRTFEEPIGPSGTSAETTNSIASSVYIGGISPPIAPGGRFGRKVWLGMLLGKSHWTGERNCMDCQYAPMKMGRPAFVEPFAIFGGGDRDGGGGVRAAYRHHFGGFEAMHGSMTLGLFFAFGKM